MVDNRKIKPAGEWFKQSDYDYETAKAMFDAGRYIYVVFMCHLAVEKKLKGIYTKKLENLPEKTHDLNFLVEKIELKLPDKLHDFIDDLNELSIPSRYPGELEKSLNDFNKTRTKVIFDSTQELLAWLTQQ